MMSNTVISFAWVAYCCLLESRRIQREKVIAGWHREYEIKEEELQKQEEIDCAWFEWEHEHED